MNEDEISDEEKEKIVDELINDVGIYGPIPVDEIPREKILLRKIKITEKVEKASRKSKRELVKEVVRQRQFIRILEVGGWKD